MGTNDIKKLEKIYNFELEKIKDCHWQFINNGWNKFTSTKRHRNSPYKTYTESKMGDIRKYLNKKLGVLPVYYFLEHILKVDVDLPGPLKHIDKGLLLLFALVTGRSCREMGEFIPPASFSKLQSKFYTSRGEIFEKDIDYRLINMFSSPEFRRISAILNNPQELNSITAIVDGYDWSVTSLEDITDYGERARYSRKLGKPGFRTQFVISRDNIILQVSESEPCNLLGDNSMLLKMNVGKTLSSIDVLGTDGGYFYNEQLGLKKEQFRKPYRKTNEKLTAEEASYRDNFNKSFSAFRGRIETNFRDINQQFKFLDKINRSREPDINRLNMKVKICAILRNIFIFQKLYNIEVPPENGAWLDENFNFYEEKAVLIPPENSDGAGYFEFDQNLNLTFLANYKIEEETGKVCLKETTLEQILNNNKDIDTSQKEERHNINKILTHKTTVGGTIQYYISWKGFGTSANRWVDESDIDKDPVCKYLKHRYYKLNKQPPENSAYYKEIVGQVDLLKYIASLCKDEKRLMEVCAVYSGELFKPGKKRTRSTHSTSSKSM
ncbi:hypothetical protein CONCODRAFT_171025 [Conidiobolus coronatus NRRL 28638]|uniref:Chromo domain-containing protein n=1 Tax=Conidiobolus coronatus (strain ATCC 28846 / CBS 209.66 / NRRL 28638) TaxID=796925 RepID=A0A137P531_CONC2|nr:hypothetical protein CONCODRAFT_171025 [Conidiobolus coronatus NRRL 28638]|eukprot:KXN70116.1 hypothetical protein CONCODRAFT_171025 [Conidiobolus coronatus NRRL 28638]